MLLQDMYPSTWLKAEDLVNGAEQFIIANVAQERQERDGVTKTENVMYFEGTEKKLTLNRTNAETIAMMYGPDTDLWIGQPVTFYKTKVQGPRGIADGIRVDARPATTPPAPQYPSQQQYQQPQQFAPSQPQNTQQAAARASLAPQGGNYAHPVAQPHRAPQQSVAAPQGGYYPDDEELGPDPFAD